MTEMYLNGEILKMQFNDITSLTMKSTVASLNVLCVVHTFSINLYRNSLNKCRILCLLSK